MTTTKSSAVIPQNYFAPHGWKEDHVSNNTFPILSRVQLDPTSVARQRHRRSMQWHSMVHCSIMSCVSVQHDGGS
eukprot:6725930-Ditylum_brightwellii.AAC.1